MTETSTSQQQVSAIARAYVDALGAQEVQRAAAMWEPDGLDRLVGIADLQGPDEVITFFKDFFAAIPDLGYEIQSITTQGDRAAVHWRMHGTFNGRGRTLGLAPNGRSFDVEGIDLLTVRDGKIVSNTAVTNVFELARQLAIMPPQNSPLERMVFALVNATAPIGKKIRGRRPRRKS